MVLYEDNTAAKDNMLSGAAGDAASQALVGAIWLVVAVLRVDLQVEYIESESNPADCFSRPDEAPKQQEARELTAMLSLCPAEARLPASLQMDAAVWASALSTSQDQWARAEREKETTAWHVALSAAIPSEAHELPAVAGLRRREQA